MAIRPLHFPLAAALAMLPALLPAPLPGAPYLVKDLNTVPVFERGQVDLEGQGIGPGVSYFAAGEPAHGVELWRSDGTPGGTERLTDICAGPCYGNPDLMTVHAGRVFFTASDGYSGEELWVSDGTPGSERRVRDLCPGPCSAIAGPLQAVRDRLLFAPYFPDDDSHGLELWQTDGTRDGTALVKTLCASYGCDLFSPLTPVTAPDGDRAVFLLRGFTGLELWVTDGTAEGTRSFHDLGSEIPLSTFNRVSPGDGFAWVWAADGLWRTDGTAAGTFRLKRIEELALQPDAINDFAGGERWHGLLLGFLWQGELIRSDGTAAGTFRIAKVAHSEAVKGFASLDSGLLFQVNDEVTNAAVLWSSGGTADTTGPAVDLEPLGQISGLARLRDDCAMFRVEATADPDRPQLWVTDGSAASTERVAVPPAGFSAGAFFPTGDGRAFLFGNRDGDDLWITDGSGAGTRKVRSFRGSPPSSGPYEQAALGGKLVFAAVTGDREAPLFISDGTAAGTRVLTQKANRAYGFFPSGGRLLFNASSSGGYPPWIWTTDGTPGGTTVLTQRTWLSSPALLDGQILFNGTAVGTGAELWTTDGVTRTASLVKDIDPFTSTILHHECEAESSYPVAGGIVGGRLLLAADDGRSGRELWSSDGTAAGTVLVRDINPGRIQIRPTPCEDPPRGPHRSDLGLSSSPQGFVVLGSIALFTADDGLVGRELWVTNGTFRGTHRVADLIPGPRGSEPHDLVLFHRRVYFLAANPGQGESLWQTDGTARGTVRVSDLVVDDEPSWASGLTVAGDRLFFVVYNETTGAELWASTGDAGDDAGTGLLVDINPGPGSSSPQSLTAVGGILLFAADDNLTGLEPWRTDGTAAGTVRLGDISPGRDASSPGPFTAIDHVVVTGADDGVHGREPWAIPRQDLVP